MISWFREQVVTTVASFPLPKQADDLITGDVYTLAERNWAVPLKYENEAWSLTNNSFGF